MDTWTLREIWVETAGPDSDGGRHVRGRVYRNLSCYSEFEDVGLNLCTLHVGRARAENAVRAKSKQFAITVLCFKGQCGQEPRALCPPERLNAWLKLGPLGDTKQNNRSSVAFGTSRSNG